MAEARNGEDSVRCEIAAGVATVTLNRPAALNALDEAMAVRLADIIERISQAAEVRAILLCGAGRGFCAGGDVSTFGDSASVNRLLVGLHRAVAVLRGSNAPVVACLHGAVAGAGLSLALACDFAIAADNAKFTLAYSRLGATPDGGATWALPRLVGVRKALEIACLSDLFGADEALRLGLVNRVAPADSVAAEALAFAQRLAAGPTLAYGRAKALIYGAAQASLAEQLDAERTAFLAGMESADFAEGRAAFAAKRAPTFVGR